MRKIILTAITVIALISIGYTQAPKVKFGRVTEEELNMKYYEKDSSADAVVLFNKGELHFNYNNSNTPRGFEYEYKEHLRIKFFNKNAFNYANQEIILRHSTSQEEKIIDFKAYTVNIENGEIVESKITKKDLMIEKFDDNTNIAKFTMPNVKEGSVIEFQYTIISDYLYYLRDWQFQYNIPVIWSEYEVITPEYFEYKQYFTGYQNLVINEKSIKSESFIIEWEGDDNDPGNFNKKVKYSEELSSLSNTFKFASAKIPAFKEESYMASTENYLFKVNFELATVKYPNSALENYAKTWESVNKELITNPDFGGQLSTNLPNELVPGIIQGLTSEEQKTAAIFHYVQNNIKWNKIYRVYTKSSLKEVLKEKSGSSAEINLLLVVMLREAGINAHPVIMSTRNNGMVNPNQPGTTQFNYVIAYALINQNSYLLDATDEYCYPNFLPKRCLNGDGRIVSEKFTDWINLNTKTSSKEVIGGNFSFDQDANLTGKIKIKKDNYFAYDFRNELDDFESNDKYIEEYQNKNHNIEISDYTFENVDSLYAPLLANYTLKISEIADQAGDMIIFNPLNIYEELNNPFKAAERKYPINYVNPFELIYVMNYQIPEGYQVSEMPKNIQFLTEDKSASFIYKIVQNGNIIQLTCKKSISKTFYMPTEYTIIRDFYNQMISKQSEKIVLKKVE